MQEQLYQPFQRMRFESSVCFLSGDKLNSTEETLNVFAPWLIGKYKLDKRPFKLLDESMVSYADIKIPCSVETAEAFEKLESTIENSFLQGYKAVSTLDEQQLFLWVAKTVYGIIFKELQIAVKQQHASGEQFHMSQGLIHKFSMLHSMLQAVIRPVKLDGFKPWSIWICEVDNAKEEFSYRDEINTLTFSLRMQDFGIILCLQDNGANKKYHEELWEKIGGAKLHPIQFEELCARVFYSAYLFNRLPEYHIMPVEDEFYMEAMPLRGMQAKPVFDLWNNKTYGQVLENFWKRWNFLLLEIIKNPERPVSYLFNENEELIKAEEINLSK